MVRMDKLEPNQAAFHVPVNVNKLDIRDYLTNLYNVTVMDVRTVIQAGRKRYNPQLRSFEREARIKKAIVTFDTTVQYPPKPNPEDFSAHLRDLSEKFTKLKLEGWRPRFPERNKLFGVTDEKAEAEKKVEAEKSNKA
ncbi:hypothetical protein BJ085DRAFT_22992 [Dimargaris cristalligena]|uniref:Large ribosomal subunit protein uL23m n=1 Tax=Dimargaris cristalligena TaxID=215637 RepID=A0A4P9ZXC3_9FUNG|nr:hypothetical protein BJ085DRAFT_22992 [Dimargaris cristalligena]|eukprot:RKP38018.1 hypothetical protein BJ085DRAFT_22992 [Dimargaris cristalligena]